MSWTVHYRCHPASENSLQIIQTQHVRESVGLNVLDELKHFSENTVNGFSLGNWLLLSETQQSSNLFHTFEDPFKNLKSCKVYLSVLVILSWSLSHSFRLPSVSIHCSIPPWRGESDLLENDGSRSGAHLESQWPQLGLWRSPWQPHHRPTAVIYCHRVYC